MWRSVAQVFHDSRRQLPLLLRFAHLTQAKMHCDILTTLEEWTEPEKPRVLEKTELQTTTDTTITIQLPVLQNPPRSV
ncbi:hypothetical protein O3P69_010111 [Scylla paramamosain]|uniref:Uncharacterized protein n=1 Tax=Scylla paramamosain TaxID=85552 RepID=A0AAW0SA84_SCYPA